MSDEQPQRLGHRASAESFSIFAVAGLLGATCVFWAIGAVGLSEPASVEAARRAWEVTVLVGSELGPSVQVLMPLVATIILAFYLAVIGGQLGSLFPRNIDVVLLQQRLTLAAYAGVVGVGVLAIVRSLALIGDVKLSGRVVGIAAEVLVVALLSVELGSFQLLSDELRRIAAERYLKSLRHSLRELTRRERMVRRRARKSTLIIGPLVSVAVVPVTMGLYLFPGDYVPAAVASIWALLGLLGFGVGFSLSVSNAKRLWAVMSIAIPGFFVALSTLFVWRFFELGELRSAILFVSVALCLAFCNAPPVARRCPMLSPRSIVMKWEHHRLLRAIGRAESRLASLTHLDADAALLAALTRGIGRGPEDESR